MYRVVERSKLDLAISNKPRIQRSPLTYSTPQVLARTKLWHTQNRLVSHIRPKWNQYTHGPGKIHSIVDLILREHWFK